MPIYYVKISQGLYGGTPETTIECKDDNEAWKDMTAVCGSLIADVARTCEPDCKWQMETQNEAKKAIFRISLVAESLS
jgi:hypothetical protein